MCNGYILPLCTERFNAVYEFLGIKRDIVSSVMDDHWTNMVGTFGQEEKTENQSMLSRWMYTWPVCLGEIYSLERNMWDVGDSYQIEWNWMVVASVETDSNV